MKALVATMVLSAKAVKIHTISHSNDVFDDPDQVEVLASNWEDQQAREFAGKIDLEGPRIEK